MLDISTIDVLGISSTSPGKSCTFPQNSSKHICNHKSKNFESFVYICWNSGQNITIFPPFVFPIKHSLCQKLSQFQNMPESACKNTSPYGKSLVFPFVYRCFLSTLKALDIFGYSPPANPSYPFYHGSDCWKNLTMKSSTWGAPICWPIRLGSRHP